MSESDVVLISTRWTKSLELVLQFAESARNAEDDVALGVYLKMASRCLRCALETYGEHLAQNALR